MSKQILSLQNDSNPLIFGSLEDFGFSNFRVEINDKGQIFVDGTLQSISYNLNEYTKQEALRHYYTSNSFKNEYKRKSFKLYFIEEI